MIITSFMYYVVFSEMMKRTSIVTVRLSKRDLKRIEELRRVENVDRSTLIKMFIDEGVRKRVVDLYRQEKLTAGRAAEILGVSLREFLEILEKAGVPVNWDIEGIREYMRDKNLKRFEKWWWTNTVLNGEEIQYKAE